MSTSNITYEVQQLVASDELIKAVKKVINIARLNGSLLLNDAIIMSRELYSLEKKMLRGIVKWEDEKSIKNQLSYRILKLISILEEDLSIKDYSTNSEYIQKYKRA